MGNPDLPLPTSPPPHMLSTGLKTYVLIVFAHPYCACKLMSQWFQVIHWACALKTICRHFWPKWKLCQDFLVLKRWWPQHCFGHITFFNKFLPIVIKWAKSQCWKFIFSHLSTLLWLNSAHFTALRVWKGNYYKLFDRMEVGLQWFVYYKNYFCTNGLWGRTLYWLTYLK